MFFKLHILTYLRPPAPGIVSDLASYEWVSGRKWDQLGWLGLWGRLGGSCVSTMIRQNVKAAREVAGASYCSASSVCHLEGPSRQFRKKEEKGEEQDEGHMPAVIWRGVLVTDSHATLPLQCHWQQLGPRPCPASGRLGNVVCILGDSECSGATGRLCHLLKDISKNHPIRV